MTAADRSSVTDNARDEAVWIIESSVPDDVPGYRIRYAEKAADALIERGLLAAGRAETTTSTRCPGCGHTACPHPRLECGGEWAETTTEATERIARQIARETAMTGMDAREYVEAVQALRHAETTTATATLMARRGGKTQALIESLLAQAKDRGLTVEVVYPETTTATDEGLRDRLQEAIAPVVAPYTSGPMDPLDVQVTDAVMGLLATAPDCGCSYAT